MMVPCGNIVCGDAFDVLQTLPDESIALTVTSPPYYRQRDYGVAGQIGQEPALDEYIGKLGKVLRELFRVTDKRGSCFIVIGDTYRERRLLLVPHRIALLACDIGWTLRNDIIWQKKSPPPESPRNRWRSGHEHILFLTKRSTGYRFNPEVIRVPYREATLRRWGAGQAYGGTKSKGRENLNDSRMRDGQVFTLNPRGCLPTDVLVSAAANTRDAHYAAFPHHMVRMLIETCSGPGDIVLDPFSGSGTTCHVADSLGRRTVGIELNPCYVTIARAKLGREDVEAA